MSEDIKAKELEKMSFSDQPKKIVGQSVKDVELENVNPLGKPSMSGWFDIDRSKLPYGGELYDTVYRFRVKPIMTATIKHYSSMDEENPLAVAEALDNVVTNHIQILDGNRVVPTENVIHENDRFFFTMLVHTYSGAPTSLSFEHTCEVANCGHKQDVNITPFTLVYSELSERGEGWLTNKGYFKIKTETLGEFKYKPITIAQSGEITQFLIDKKRIEKVDIEKQFLEFAPILMHTMPEGTEVKHLYQKYIQHTSDQTKLSLYHRIAELCEHKLTMEVKGQCGKCNRPFQTKISSLEGLRKIFFVSDIDSEFS